jgi:hypothetical protein
MPRGKSKRLTIDDTVVEPNEATEQAEQELVDFIDSVGPEGVSEVSLYRILQTGKWRFLISGPPSQFSEQYVQHTFGGGDYLIRGKINGRWFRSKTFSVEGLNVDGNGKVNPASDELERLRLLIQEQQVRMEAERASALQRSHELQLALIQGHTGAPQPQMTIADMITAVKSLNDMGGQDQIDKAIERIFSLATKVQQLTGTGNGATESSWWDWAKPVVQEASKQLLPKVLPFLGNGPPPMAQTPAQTPAAIMPANATPVGHPAMAPPTTEGMPAPHTAMDDTERFEAEYRAQKHEALSFALGMARMNRAPEIWADFAIEQVQTSNNPVTARFLQEVMQAKDFNTWFEELQKIEPSAVTERGWFEAFFQTVRETLSAGPPSEEKS